MAAVPNCQLLRSLTYIDTILVYRYRCFFFFLFSTSLYLYTYRDRPVRKRERGISYIANFTPQMLTSTERESLSDDFSFAGNTDVFSLSLSCSLSVWRLCQHFSRLVFDFQHIIRANVFYSIYKFRVIKKSNL